MFSACQEDENDVAKLVVICSPSLPKMMGTLHPAGSLYENPVNTDTAKMQHDAFRTALEHHGIKVLEVAEILMMDVDKEIGARMKLEEFALESLTYEFDRLALEDKLSKEDMYYVGDHYKRQTVEAMSAEQLVDIIMTRPSVTLLKSYRDTGFTALYAFAPLSNMVFTRDQQVPYFEILRTMAI